MTVVIVDTGCANLSSVNFALQRLGIDAVISSQAKTIKSAKRVILPGVGAAGFAMDNLKKLALVDTITSLSQPVLGICLGMQILFTKSEEGPSSCLDVIPADIEKMQVKNLPLPHMGWNQLRQVHNSPLLKNVEQNSYVYFVHSYAAPPREYTLAQANYGQPFSAMVQKDNFFGCQFHPERSGKVGAQILKNFCEKSL